MALACEDSRMSVDSELSNLSPCKPVANTNNNKTTSSATYPLLSTVLSTDERRFVVKKEEPTSPSQNQKQQVECPRFSWAEIVEKEEQEKNSPKSSPLVKEEDSSAVSTTTSTLDLVKCDTKMSMEDSNSNTSLRSTGSNRQIEIDILDTANVEKYEKLVRDDKIKSPFKRRLSGGGEDDDTNRDDGHAKFVDAEPGFDQQYKKTKISENDHGRARFRRESSSSSADSGSQSSRKPIEYEKDLSILERRQKQIDYGKNTLGYENYIKQVSRDKRTKEHPKTPPKHVKYSRRAWDGLVKVWRKKLHCFDPDAKQDADNEPTFLQE